MMTSSNGTIFRVTGQWRWAVMFSLICFWKNGWINNREAGNLRRYRANYDVSLMLSRAVCMDNTVIHSTCNALRSNIRLHWIHRDNNTIGTIRFELATDAPCFALIVSKGSKDVECMCNKTKFRLHILTCIQDRRLNGFCTMTMSISIGIITVSITTGTWYIIWFLIVDVECIRLKKILSKEFIHISPIGFNFHNQLSDIDGLAQDYSNSIANALELLQSCTKPSI